MASCRSTSWAAALKARQPLQVSADLVLHVWVVWQGADDHLALAVVPPAQDHAPAKLRGVPGDDHYASRASLTHKEGCVESAGHERPQWDT